MIRILKGSSRHVGENNSTSNLLITKRDLGHSQETIERPKRKTSVALVRRNSLKYLSEASLEIQSSSTKMSPEEKSLQFENIRKMEEINTIMEILFLIHTSPICQKILKNSKLPSPTINLSTFSSNLIK